MSERNTCILCGRGAGRACDVSIRRLDLQRAMVIRDPPAWMKGAELNLGVLFFSAWVCDAHAPAEVEWLVNLELLKTYGLEDVYFSRREAARIAGSGRIFPPKNCRRCGQFTRARKFLILSAHETEIMEQCFGKATGEGGKMVSPFVYVRLGPVYAAGFGIGDEVVIHARTGRIVIERKSICQSSNP